VIIPDRGIKIMKGAFYGCTGLSPDICEDILIRFGNQVFERSGGVIFTWSVIIPAKMKGDRNYA